MSVSFGAGAKDKLVGTAKEVVGGLTGKGDLKSQGEQQAVRCLI